jgi:ABC exporter DevB family membrane fusion protein
MKSRLFPKAINFPLSALVAGASLTLLLALMYVMSMQKLNPQKEGQVTSNHSDGQIQPDNIAAIGYIVPQGDVIKISAPLFIDGALRLEKLLVKLGDRVQKGQILGVLDNYHRLQASLEQAQGQLQIAMARLEQVRSGAKTGDIEAQSAKTARIGAELAGQIDSQKALLTNLKAQLSGETRSQKATIQRIEAELANARLDCQRYQSLHQDGAVAIRERDRICLEQQTSLAKFQEAQAQLALITETRNAQIKEAEANLERTIKTLQKQIFEDRARLKAVAEVRPVDVQVALAEVATARANLKKAQVELELAYLRAPQDGQILKIHTQPGEIVKNEGIVELGRTDKMYVRAEVYETDIDRVKIGQSALIKSDGVAGDLRGTVTEVGLQIGRKNVLGTDPVADTDARVVEVKIRLHPRNSQRVAQLTNLRVDVLIQPESKVSLSSP